MPHGGKDFAHHGQKGGGRCGADGFQLCGIFQKNSEKICGKNAQGNPKGRYNLGCEIYLRSDF